MSSIDERVVEMRFDNKQFEAGAKQSMNTLDELEKSLRLDGSTRGIEELQRSINSFSVLSMTDSINTIAERFSTMGIIATTALVNITNRAIAAGEALLKSLTVDNIASGWEKFSKDTVSVGTLIAQGYDLSYVENQLKRLMNFSDETSYHYADMVDNLGKFTAAGRNLEDSITAMQGIALWTASTGQNAAVADRAMVQLSQAMGAGMMRRQDWMSIQTLNMDTDQFRQVALDTAVALGKLKQTGEDTYKSLQAKTKAGAAEFKKSQFAESLTQGAWFDYEVMMGVYEKYGSAVKVVDEYMAEHSDTIETVSEGIRTLEEEQTGKIEEYAKSQKITTEEATKQLLNFDEAVKKYADDNKVSLEEAGEAMDKYRLKVDPMALTWYKAGQEARTFEDVIISVKDAVSTKLMAIFKDIVGNYEEATNLFSNMADTLWEILVAPADKLKEMMDMWHEFGGRVHLLYGFKHAWEGILKITDQIKEAFSNIFPNETTWQGLVKATFEFSKFTKSLIISDEAASNVKRIFEGLFSIFDIVGQVFSAVTRTISGFSPAIKSVAGSFLEGAAAVGDFFKDMATAAKESDFFYNSIQKVIEYVSPAFEFLNNLVSKAIELFEKFTGIDLHIPTFKEFSETLQNIGNVFKPITNLAGNAANAVRNFFVGLNTPNDELEHKVGIFENLGKIFGKIGKILKPIAKSIGDAFNDLLTNISNALDGFNGSVFLSGMGGGLAGIGIFKWLYDLYWEVKLFKEPVDLIKDTIGTIGSTLIGVLKGLENDIKADAITRIAKAIAILAAAMLVLSFVKTDKLAANAVAIYALMSMLVQTFTAMATLETTADGIKIAVLTGALNGLAIAILIISAAVKLLSTIELKDIGTPIIAMIGIFSMLTTFISEMEGFAFGMGEATAGLVGLSVGVLIISFALKNIGALPIDQALKGAIGVGIILGELGVFLQFAGEAKHVIGTGVALLAIASSLLVITGVLAIMGKFSKTMGTGLIVMGAALFELATALHFMEGSLKGAAAMLIVSAAMLILAPALVLLGKALNGDQIGILILALAGTLLVLTAAAYAVSPVAPVLVAVGAAVALLGIGLLAASGAMVLFSINFSMAVQTFLMAAGNLGKAKLAESMQILFNTIIDAVINGIMGLIKSILMIIPKLADVVVALVDAFLATLAEHLPSIIDSIATIAIALLVGLDTYLPLITDVGFILAIDFINAIADGLEEHQDDIFKALGHLLASLINFALSAIQIFAKDLPIIGKTVSDAIDDLKNAVKEALDPSELEDAAGIGAESVTHAFETASGEAYETGGKTGAAFGEGIADSSDKAAYGVNQTAEEIQREFDTTVSVWDENGNQINEHLAAGIEESSDLPNGACEKVTDNIMSILGDTSKYEQIGIDGITSYVNGWDNPEQRARLKNLLSDISGPDTEGVMRKTLKSHSPSKVTYKIGIDAGRGYILGLEGSEKGVKDASGNLADTTIAELGRAVDAQVGILDYADNAVGMFYNHWALGQDELSNDEGFKISTDALELLALQLYETSQAADDAKDKAKDASKSSVEVLQDIRKAYQDYRDDIKKTIDGQIDMFEMFDFGKKIRPEEMIENMESNVRALETYRQELNSLLEKGVERGLYEHLGKMGLKAIGTIQTLNSMTQEQFEKANELWRESGSMMENTVDSYMSGLAFINGQSQEGFAQGLDPETGMETGKTYIEATLEGMREALGVNLQDFVAQGELAADAVGEGLENASKGTNSKTSKSAKQASDSVVETVDTNVKKEDGYNIGHRLCEGIADGIRAGIEIATTAAEEMALRLIQIVKDTLGIASPSKAFMELGYYSDEGLAQGFSKYGTVVREAAAESALGAVNEMSGVFGHIADLIDGTIDLDPTIRPVLDLSNLQYGASQIGSLLGLNDPYALNAVGTISGIQNDASLMAGLTSSLTDAINGMKTENDLPPVTINIYPTENQSAEEIANVVSWKINHDVLKRRAAYGGAR